MNNEETPLNIPGKSATQQDLEQIWLQIGTDIKIRRFGNLADVLEFHQLPNQLQSELKSGIIGLNNDYKVYHNEQNLGNFHAILFVKDEKKYLAIYEDKTPSQQVRASLTAIGFIGLCLFVWSQLSKTFDTIQTTTTNSQQPSSVLNDPPNNVNTSWNWGELLAKVSSIIPAALGYPLFRKWFSTRDSAYNKLIEGCMLRKLEDIYNSDQSEK